MIPFLLLLFVSSPSTASAVPQDSRGRSVEGPLVPAELDLATGSITRGPVLRTRGVPTCSTFNNDLGGFIGVDTGGCAVEWYDAGVKSGGKSTLVSGFVMAYCTSALDTSSGGPGGTAEISFRSGYTAGGSGFGLPPNGVEVARMLLTGLPGADPGGTRCWLLNVRLANTFTLPDGFIGYGWKFVDVEPLSNLAATVPFMSCIDSCQSSGPDALGQIGGVDRYSPPGTLESIPGLGGTLALFIDIRELPSTGAFPSASFGATNPAVLADAGGTLGFGPVLGDPGEPYRQTLNCSSATTPGLFQIELRPGLSPTGIPTAFGLLHATGSVQARFRGFHLQNTVSSLQVVVPSDPSLAGLAYTSQGWCQSAPLGFLSNAIRETVGVP